MAAPHRSPTARSERTRASLLAAAERCFAERGFDGTRLEEVAQAVGIKRASIVYHFRDKAALYDAVLEQLLGELYSRLEVALATPGEAIVAVQAAVAAWSGFIGQRPTFARILLREVASAAPDAPPVILAHLAPFHDLIGRFQQTRTRGAFQQDDLSIALIASTIAGSSLFFTVALPTLAPQNPVDPNAPGVAQRLDAHLRSITRWLLPAKPEARDEN